MTLNSPLKFFDLTISIEQFETFVLIWNWRVRTRNLRCLLPLSSVNQRAIDFVSVFFFFSFVQTQEEERIFLSLACMYSLLLFSYISPLLMPKQNRIYILPLPINYTNSQSCFNRFQNNLLLFQFPACFFAASLFPSFPFHFRW